MTGQGPKKSGKPNGKKPVLPKYYMIGLVIMLVGLIVSIKVSETLGLIILVIGFGLGITGRIYSRKGPTKTPSTDQAEEPKEQSSASREEVLNHPVNMIRCKYCGTTFADTSIKCPNCGAGHS